MSQVRWKKWLNTFFLYLRVPFNWKTKFGYLVYVVFFIVGGLTLTISASATICLCIGLFLLMISFIEDATNDLIRLNVDENFKSYDFDVKMRFRSAAQAHSDLKELSTTISQVISLIYLVLFSIFVDSSTNSASFISLKFLLSSIGVFWPFSRQFWYSWQNWLSMKRIRNQYACLY